MRRTGVVAMLACLMLASGASAAVISVADGMTVTHGFSDADLYSRSGGWFDGGKYYLSGGSSGELVYAYQAPVGETISSVDLKLKTYFEAGSWAVVSTSTNGTDWTAAGYNYPGYNQWWTQTITPNSSTVYVKYSGKNEGTEAYQFQLWGDSATFATVPEPMTMVLLCLGGVAGVVRRRTA